MRVLIVEDSEDNAILIKVLLELDGYTVDCAGTKAQALKHLRANRYDIGLLDLMLPDAVKLEVFDAVHAAAPSMPIVILSAMNDNQMMAEAIKRGAFRYLVKTTDPNVLLDTIQAALKSPE